ncbi:MAG: hypothetical protein OHK0046_51130 [Anaerolineae bacterium]
MRQRILLMLLIVFALNIPAAAQTTITIGQIVDGNLEIDGDIDEYIFTATEGQTVFLDLQQANFTDPNDVVQVTWRIQDAALTVLYTANIGDMNAPLTLTAGDYTLVVDGNDNETGTYRFRLWNVPTPPVFDVAIGDTISNGVPAAGAGNLETPGSSDVYAFTATPGQNIFLDLGSTDFRDPDGGLVRVDWTVRDALDAVVYTAVLGDSSGSIELADGGDYTLTVDALDDELGTYAFTIWDVPAPDTFAINPGDTIANGIPAAGAGNLEGPGETDVYTVDVTNGDTLFFDLVSTNFVDPDGTEQVRLLIIDPTDTQVNNPFLGDTPISITQDGTYQLIVDANDDENGTYSFTLWEVPSPDTFDITIGTVVSEDSPQAGAGNLETPGVSDVYNFTAAANQTIFLDYNGGTFTDPDGSARVDWTLTVGPSTELFTNLVGDMNTPLVLAAGGVYSLEVKATDDETGVYGFTLWNVPAPDTFAIEIGDVVAEVLTGTGAGNLESPGVTDVYTFEGAANQEIILNVVTSNFTDGDGTSAQINWTLTDSAQTVIYTGAIGDTEPITLPSDDTYTLVVDGNDDETGTYVFGLADTNGPTAAADNYATTANGVLTVDAASGVLANDTDPQSDPLTAELITTTINGTLTLNADGGFTYTPNAGFTGDDNFTYRAKDATTASLPALVSITVSDATPTPTNTPTATATATPTVTPTATATLAPGELSITIPPNGYATPIINWDSTGADWYQVTITLEAGNLQIYNQWTPEDELCAGGPSCELVIGTNILPFGLGEGDHTLTVNAWTWTNEAAGAGDFALVGTEPFNVSPRGLVDASSGRPVITFQDSSAIEWVNVFVGTPDFSQTVDFRWYEKARSATCTGGTCTLLPNANPLNGDYVVYLQVWDGRITSWSGPFLFSLDFEAASEAVALTPAIIGGVVTFRWNNDGTATWYQLFVGSQEGGVYSTAYAQWNPATALGCAGGGVCAITPTVEYAENTAYEYWLQAFGPGGIDQSAGFDGWVKAGEIVVSQ